jgi:hypothetical protein
VAVPPLDSESIDLEAMVKHELRGPVHELVRRLVPELVAEELNGKVTMAVTTTVMAPETAEETPEAAEATPDPGGGRAVEAMLTLQGGEAAIGIHRRPLRVQSLSPHRGAGPCPSQEGRRRGGNRARGVSVDDTAKRSTTLPMMPNGLLARRASWPCSSTTRYGGGGLPETKAAVMPSLPRLSPRRRWPPCGCSSGG